MFCCAFENQPSGKCYLSDQFIFVIKDMGVFCIDETKDRLNENRMMALTNGEAFDILKVADLGSTFIECPFLLEHMVYSCNE